MKLLIDVLDKKKEKIILLNINQNGANGNRKILGKKAKGNSYRNNNFWK